MSTKTLRSIASVIGCLLLIAGVAGAETVEEGHWINLFDGETMFGWNVLGDAEFGVEDGRLTSLGGVGGWAATTNRFKDFELEARVRVAPGTSSGLAVRADLEQHPLEGGAVLWLFEPDDATPSWKDVRIVAQGDVVTVEVDGEPLEEFDAENVRGHIGVFQHRGGKVEVEHMRLRPRNLSPIFNGEDLTGWNIIPNRESDFFVEDGLLRVLDGPGQIETDAVYQNLLIQLEVYSDGEHLNSGVFFRGPKEVFWRGYEAQIRNQWEGDDRTRPVDYGTGGIYAVQPAREVVSSDYEWFTMTIVCDENQISVWVDDYLVADFTDTRPVNADGDAKAGFVPVPGTIHLQGHDPATDLSFRGINIQEYPDTK